MPLSGQFTSRLDESTYRTASKYAKPQSTRVEEDTNEQSGGWQRHMKNILFRWKRTTSTEGNFDRDADRQGATHLLDIDGSFPGMTSYSQVSR